MYRNLFILMLLLPLLLSAQINTGGGSYTDTAGNTQIYKPWPNQNPPTTSAQLPGAMWIVSFAINDMAATIGRYGTDLQLHEKAIEDFDGRLNTLNASLSAISANSQKTGTGGGIVQIKDWPLSAVLAQGAIDTDHGITVKTVDTTGNITSSSGSVIANIITGREGITTLGWIQANGNVTAGTLTSGGGIAAGGKVTGVSEPTVGTDAATKAYVDNAVANVGTNSIILYRLTSTSEDGFTLSPVKLMGVTLGDPGSSPSYTFSRKTVVESVAVSSDKSKLTEVRSSVLVASPSASGASEEIFQFIDHGTLNP